MKTIILLSENKAQNTQALLRPLQLFKDDLKRHGIKIRRVNFMHPLFFIGADEVWINSKNFRSLWGKKEKRIIKFFNYFHKKNIPIKYFDTGDSAGSIQQGALGHVKKYYKFFLYKDRSHYLNRLYGNRLFTHYYHQQFNIHDQGQSENVFKPLSTEDVSKLDVFWGPSAIYLSKKNVCKPPLEDKTISFSARFHQSYNRPTVAFQRIESAKILNEMGFDCGKICKEQFIEELKNSQISYSPFGWGEFAFRDYEIMRNNTLLLKPDMKDIETWPEIYLDNETYIPINWNLSDLPSRINHFTAHKNECEKISNFGYEKFNNLHEGEAAFSNFFNRLLKVIRD